MKDLLEKVSSYNIFNNLLPGVVFVAVSSKLTAFNFIQQDILVGFFMYYFIGLIISRIGSLFIGPLLKLVRFIRFAEYKAFLRASKVDGKIDVLSEANNMYRTIISMFIMLGILKLYETFGEKWAILEEWKTEILITSLLLLFLFSYRKQSRFITKRIEAHEEG
ncbi:MAG: hypothetical protein KA239_00300 [Bacteroidia bacterium]|nr:hypothetical protein [Bacteroidia bacterium]